MIPYIEYLKDANSKLLPLINAFGKFFHDTKLICRILLHFYTLLMKEEKQKLKNNPIYNHIQKNKIPRNIMSFSTKIKLYF